MPRPTRRFACLEPAAVDHAAHRRRVLQFAGAVELAEAKATHGIAVRLLGPNRAAHQLDRDCVLSGHSDSDQLRISSIDLPRLAATLAGVVEFFNASSVARTRL